MRKKQTKTEKPTITIPMEVYFELRDRATCLTVVGNPVYCKGGRIVNGGYICPHCSSREPSRECYGEDYQELAEPKFMIKTNKKDGSYVGLVRKEKDIHEWKALLVETLLSDSFEKLVVIRVDPFEDVI